MYMGEGSGRLWLALVSLFSFDPYHSIGKRQNAAAIQKNDRYVMKQGLLSERLTRVFSKFNCVPSSRKCSRLICPCLGSTLLYTCNNTGSRITRTYPQAFTWKKSERRADRRRLASVLALLAEFDKPRRLNLPAPVPAQPLLSPPPVALSTLSSLVGRLLVATGSPSLVTGGGRPPFARATVFLQFHGSVRHGLA